MATSVILADGHAMVRQGLRLLLEEQEILVVGEASDGYQAVRLCARLRPDVALFEFAMPLLNGVDAARETQGQESPPAVVLMSADEDDRRIQEALRAGVAGYVLKTSGADDLIKAVREVARGGVYFNAGCSREAVDALVNQSPPADPISLRERQVVQLVAEGKTTKEVAAILNIGVKTADYHRGRVMKKLGIHGTAGIVRYAIRNGIIEP